MNTPERNQSRETSVLRMQKSMTRLDKSLPPLPLSSRKILAKTAQPPELVRLSPSIFNPSQLKSQRKDGRLESTNRNDIEAKDRMQKLRQENENLSRKLMLLENTSAAKEQMIAKLKEDNRVLYCIACDTRQRVASIATAISEAFEQYQEFTEAQSQILDASISDLRCDEIRVYAEGNLSSSSSGLVTNVGVDADVGGECADSSSEYSIEF